MPNVALVLPESQCTQGDDALQRSMYDHTRKDRAVGYEFQSRALPELSLPTFTSIRNGVTSKSKWFETTGIASPTQETRSWRTHGRGELDEVDARIFRNGFTSNDPRFDRGHSFFTTRTSWWVSHWDAFVQAQIGLRETGAFRGPIIPRVVQLTKQRRDRVTGKILPGWDPYPALPGDADVVTLGTKAIKACAPAAPQANVATALTELYRDLPAIPLTSLFRDRARQSDVGGEYLNWSFGVVPTISDMKSILRALRDHTRLLQQYSRDNGKIVRRSFTFPQTLETTSYRKKFPSGGPVYGMAADWFVAGEAVTDVEQTVRITRDVWFKGAFTYYVPIPDGVAGKFAEWTSKADYLLGLKVTPEALWQLMPWSWLIDWFTSIGDVISNATRLSDNGLVVRYGYLMVKTDEVHDWHFLPGLTARGGGQVPNASIQFRRVTKQRYQATPFGFATDWEGLSPSQWAILAALGLSRT